MQGVVGGNGVMGLGGERGIRNTGVGWWGSDGRGGKGVVGVRWRGVRGW